MAQLVWDETTKRIYETGLDRGVLYPSGASAGVAWPGLLSISEAPSGGDPRPYYFDGFKYLNISSSEEFAATLVALSCPPEFGPCDGMTSINNGLFITQQPRQAFSLSYRTLLGNLPQGLQFGYKIHLVYDALSSPADRGNQSLGDSADPLQLSWAITTKPPAASGYKPTSHFVIDSRYTDDAVMTELTDILYGTVDTSPRMPTTAELLAIFS